MQNEQEDNFFVALLKKIFAIFENKEMSKEEENEALTSLGENETEKNAISQFCDEVDELNDDMKDWIDEGMPEPGQRLESELIKLAKENDNTPEEIEMIPRLTEEALDDAIINESRENGATISGQEMTEEEIQTIKAEEK